MDWYNRIVGDAYLGRINYSPCLHILDCTELEVSLKNGNYDGNYDGNYEGNYEGSGISRREKKKPDGSVEE